MTGELHELIVKLSNNIGEFRDRDLVLDFELKDIIAEIDRRLKELDTIYEFHKELEEFKRRLEE